jgi:AraC-like DNA-binding protein
MVQVDYQPHLYDMLHQHPEVQLTLVVEGTGSLFLADYIGDFNPGDIFIVGSNVPHVFKNDRQYYQDLGLMAHHISIFFDEQTFGQKNFRISEVKEIHEIILSSKRGLKVTGKVREKMAEIIRNIVHKNGLTRVLDILQIFDLLAQNKEFEFLSLENVDYDVDENEGNRLNEVLQFTLNEYDRHITIEEAAKVANLTPSSFCRFFKQRTRKTYLNFLTDIRISQACKFLLDKNLTITQVCFMAGFNNVSNFNRQFKKTKGLSPTEFVKMLEG